MEQERAHRGRIQAQGPKKGPSVEITRSWAQASPPTVQEGLAWLDELWHELSSYEQDCRREAYDKAKEFILRAGKCGGVRRIKQSYPQPPRGDQRRIDIEVLSGAAFVPESESEPSYG